MVDSRFGGSPRAKEHPDQQRDNGIFEIHTSRGLTFRRYNNPHAGSWRSRLPEWEHLSAQGSGNLITLRNDVQPDFINIHSNFIYANFADGTFWTAGGTVRWETRTTTGIPHSRRLFGHRQHWLRHPHVDEGVGLDKMGIWNSTNSWLYTTTSFTPTRYDVMRMAFGQDGTAGRNCASGWGDLQQFGCATSAAKAVWGRTWTSSSTRPNETVTALVSGDYQYLWLRLAYRRCLVCQADMDNMIGPTSFYTVL